MYRSNQIEDRIEDHQIQINKLTVQLESLDLEVDEFFNHLHLSLEKISAFISRKENFSEDSWLTLLQKRKELEDKLQREIANIRNPSKTKKALSSLRIKPNWIPVR